MNESHGFAYYDTKGYQITGQVCFCGQTFPSYESLRDHLRFVLRFVRSKETPVEHRDLRGPLKEDPHKEEAVIEQDNVMAYDALRLAVDLNTSHQLVLDEARVLRRQAVLADAEAFYDWLKKMQEK